METVAVIWDDDLGVIAIPADALRVFWFGCWLPGCS